MHSSMLPAVAEMQKLPTKNNLDGIDVSEEIIVDTLTGKKPS